MQRRIYSLGVSLFTRLLVALFQALSSVKQQCQELCASLPLDLVVIHQFRVCSSSTVQEVHHPEWDLHAAGRYSREEERREASTHLLVSVQQKKVVGQSMNGGL